MQFGSAVMAFSKHTIASSWLNPKSHKKPLLSQVWASGDVDVKLVLKDPRSKPFFIIFFKESQSYL
jgi:hypothetical protein